VLLWPTWAAAVAARNVDIPYVLSPRGMLVEDLIAAFGMVHCDRFLNRYRCSLFAANALCTSGRFLRGCPPRFSLRLGPRGYQRWSLLGNWREASMPPRALSKLAETNSRLSASAQLLSAPPSSDFLEARLKLGTPRQQVHAP
jgi:hypothetical protein